MIGKTVSHYKIIGKLGEGGMGVVYLADDLKLNRQVAIKFLPEHLTKDRESVERFEREANTAAALNHPNIVTIHEIAEENGQTFIVMEYIDGQSLRELIIDNRQLPIDNYIDIIAQICEGLSEAHRADIVHRDIKPENILIDSRGRVKILDFGLAKLRGISKLTKETSTLGTVHYMSPEQVQGKDVDHRSDIWSLGIVFYELLTGEVPFTGDYEQAVSYAILNENIKLFIDKDTPEELESIIEKCLTKNPADRYQNADEIKNDLSFIKEESTIKPTRRIRLNNKRYFKIALPFILAIAAVVTFLFVDKEAESTAPIPIAVVDFVNDTGDSTLNGLSGLLTTALEQSRRLSVITRSRMFDILKQLDKQNIDYIDEKLGREIANFAGIKVLVLPSVQKFDRLYVIDLKVIDTKEDKYLFTDSEDGEGKAMIYTMIDLLAEKTREGLEESEDGIQLTAKPVAEITTQNIEAYQHYFKGQEYIDKLNFNLAKEEFKKAIKLDSTFGLAYYRLAYAVDWEMNPQHSAKYITKAISFLNRIPEKERYLARALATNLQEGRSAAIKVLTEMEKIYPNEKEMLYNIGDWSYHVGDLVKAKEYLEKVITMDSVFVRALQHLTWTYRDLGLFENMFHIAKQYNSISDSKESFNLLSDAYIELGSFKEGLQFIKRTRELHPERDYLTRIVAKFYEYQERYVAAEKELKSLVGEDKPQSSRLLGYSYLANFYCYLGKHRESIKACDYMIDYYWQQKDTSLASYWQVAKGYLIYTAWDDIKAAEIEIRKTFPYQSSIDYIYYWSSLTIFYIFNGEFDLAEKQAKLTSTKWWELAVLSLIHNQKKECTESEILVDTVLLSCPGFIKIELLYYLAKCQFEQKEFSKSAQSLIEMQSIRDISLGLRALYFPRSFYLLGKIYEQTGDRNLALKYYTKFLEMWKNADEDLPELIDAQKRLDSLQKIAGR